MSRIYRPLRDKIIIQVDAGETKTESGIIITLQGQQESMAKEEGVVISIGKSCFMDGEPEDLKPGDRVAFAKYAGKLLKRNTDGTEIRTLRDIDILCIIEEEVQNGR